MFCKGFGRHMIPSLWGLNLLFFIKFIHLFWNLFTRFKNAGKAGMEFSRYKDDSRSVYQSFLHDMRLDIRSNKITGPAQLLVGYLLDEALTGGQRGSRGFYTRGGRRAKLTRWIEFIQ